MERKEKGRMGTSLVVQIATHRGSQFPKDGGERHLPFLHAWLCKTSSFLKDNWDICVARLVLLVFEIMAMGSGEEERESDVMSQ